MKNFYNDKKQTTGSRIWLAVLTVVASLAFSVNAYGAADFWENGTCNLNIWNGADVWLGGAYDKGYNRNTGAECVYAYGTTETMYLKQWWTKLYKNGSDNVCNDTLFYKLYGSTKTHKYGGQWIENLSASSGSNNERWGCSGDMSINVISTLCKSVPGDYTLEYWFKAEVSSDCADLSKHGSVYSNNGNLNYKVSFTYPGIVLTTKSVKIEELSGSQTVSFTQYGFSDNSYGTEIAGTGASSFAVSDKQPGSLIVTYIGSSNVIETATLTITPPAGKGAAVEIPLEGSTGQAPLPILGDTLILNGNNATLSGYLKYTGCFEIKDFGFYYCVGEGCTPPTSSEKVAADGCDGTKVLQRGELFSKTLTGLEYSPATWYAYRSYVVFNNGSDQTALSDEVGRFLVNQQCKLPEGDTLYVEVDSVKYKGKSSVCDLKFASVQRAISAIKGLSEVYADGALKRNVVIEIDGSTYTTETKIGSVTGGGKTDAYCHQFHDINNVANPTKWLILRAKNPVNKPTILHPSIRNSKLIRFENVRLVGDETTKDNAIDLENGYGDKDGGWFKQPLGAVANANIQFINCYIKSWGFACLHASAYDLITFENCDFEAELTDATDDAIAWGASAKFIHCSNIKFQRNNFRGSHATSVWLQGCQKALFINNVFWNNNLITTNVAFARLVSQNFSSAGCFDPKLQEIAFYYNTMYFAACPSTVSSAYKVDFFRLGSKFTNIKLSEGTIDTMEGGDIDVSSLAFQFNNCYSYEETYVTGRTADNDVFLNLNKDDFCTRIRNNNFWSAYDEAQGSVKSVFDLGCYNNYINVPSQVCTTGAEDPSGLVIKGVDLNTGSRISIDVSGLGAETMSNDRLHAETNRPASGIGWTVGAYQQSTSSDPLTEIVWFGGADTWRAGKSTAEAQVAWDNRNNWYKMNGERVTCVDNLAADVKVIIPEANSKVYPHPEGGIQFYPTLPAFTSEDRQTDTERVDAGLGVLDEKEAPTKFFETLELEEGAAIKGVENLYSDGVRHYIEAKNTFTAGRNEWILVGTVIKPFTDDTKTTSRYIKSGDYYIANQTPHVYMHEASASGATVTWAYPFADMDKEVPADKVFAIMLPDQYGPYKYPADSYYKRRDPSKVGDATVSKTFNFDGHFYNEDHLPSYTGLTKGTAVMLSNTYPANINVETVSSQGTFQVYDYDEKNWSQTTDGEIRSQQGFYFNPEGTSLTLTANSFNNGSTKYKSSSVDIPSIYVKVANNSGEGGCKVLIRYDQLKTDEYSLSQDAPKAFNEMKEYAGVPDLYALRYDQKLAGVVVPSLEAIPLGLNIKKDMTVTFSKYSSEDFAKAELIDMETGKSYDLLEGETCVVELKSGVYEERFFLNLSVEDEEAVPTDADDVSGQTNSISISSNGKSVVIKSSESVILKSAEITDMSGRTTYVNLNNAHHNIVKISGVQGVYVVKAIGDVMSATSKVLVK